MPGFAGSPRRGPRLLRGTVHRLVNRQGVAGSSWVQWRPVMLPLAGISGDDGGTVALCSYFCCSYIFIGF